MKITLVRHAQTENNYNGIMQGRANTPLNDTGRRQCQRLRDKLLDNEYDFCYMSPLVRCVETAFILIGDRVPTATDNRLIERDLGELEGKERSFYDTSKYWQYELNSCDFGVESVQDLLDRSKSFLDYIAQKHIDQSILVVTHSAIFRALKILISGKKLKGNLFDKAVENCEYIELDYK